MEFSHVDSCRYGFQLELLQPSLYPSSIQIYWAGNEAARVLQNDALCYTKVNVYELKALGCQPTPNPPPQLCQKERQPGNTLIYFSGNKYLAFAVQLCRWILPFSNLKYPSANERGRCKMIDIFIKYILKHTYFYRSCFVLSTQRPQVNFGTLSAYQAIFSWDVQTSQLIYH